MESLGILLCISALTYIAFGQGLDPTIIRIGGAPMGTPSGIFSITPPYSPGFPIGDMSLRSGFEGPSLYGPSHISRISRRIGDILGGFAGYRPVLGGMPSLDGFGASRYGPSYGMRSRYIPIGRGFGALDDRFRSVRMGPYSPGPYYGTLEGFSGMSPRPGYVGMGPGFDGIADRSSGLEGIRMGTSRMDGADYPLGFRRMDSSGDFLVDRRSGGFALDSRRMSRGRGLSRRMGDGVDLSRGMVGGGDLSRVRGVGGDLSRRMGGGGDLSRRVGSASDLSRGVGSVSDFPRGMDGSLDVVESGRLNSAEVSLRGDRSLYRDTGRTGMDGFGSVAARSIDGRTNILSDSAGSFDGGIGNRMESMDRERGLLRKDPGAVDAGIRPIDGGLSALGPVVDPIGVRDADVFEGRLGRQDGSPAILGSFDREIGSLRGVPGAMDAGIRPIDGGLPGIGGGSDPIGIRGADVLEGRTGQLDGSRAILGSLDRNMGSLRRDPGSMDAGIRPVDGDLPRFGGGSDPIGVRRADVLEGRTGQLDGSRAILGSLDRNIGSLRGDPGAMDVDVGIRPIDGGLPGFGGGMDPIGVRGADVLERRIGRLDGSRGILDGVSGPISTGRVSRADSFGASIEPIGSRLRTMSGVERSMNRMGLTGGEAVYLESSERPGRDIEISRDVSRRVSSDGTGAGIIGGRDARRRPLVRGTDSMTGRDIYTATGGEMTPMVGGMREIDTSSGFISGNDGFSNQGLVAGNGRF